ncbi:helix-turn-helix domain-containing protein [Bartonella tribocorum]|uniref:Transcriptional regulator n=1 Tax=Bartonella tribocorum TaxID=85701 RepID=A0A2M6UQD3_9HYPH|nr:helix-turn-helix transcriptional regulator [Bartonella tribocorum]PIT68385.1 transcriptional regulator [Bartonella tribocorum]
MQTKNSHFNDISIGKRIRYKRISMGLSQKELGNHLGVSFQQIQKYEKGTNRVSAGCLLEIAQKLQVPMSFFYADLLTADLATKEDLVSEDNVSHHDQNITSKQDITSEKEQTLLRKFRELKPKKQKAILWLISD